MKKITIGILIGFAISFGIVVSASQKLVMVPQAIFGYDTVGLLTDLAKQKYSNDYSVRESQFITNDSQLKSIEAMDVTPSNLRAVYLRQRKDELKKIFESENPKLY